MLNEVTDCFTRFSFTQKIVCVHINHCSSSSVVGAILKVHSPKKEYKKREKEKDKRKKKLLLLTVLDLK